MGSYIFKYYYCDRSIFVTLQKKFYGWSRDIHCYIIYGNIPGKIRTVFYRICHVFPSQQCESTKWAQIFQTREIPLGQHDRGGYRIFEKGGPNNFQLQSNHLYYKMRSPKARSRVACDRSGLEGSGGMLPRKLFEISMPLAAF